MITLRNVKQKSLTVTGILTFLMVAGWACMASAQVVLSSPLLPPESDPDDCDALTSLYGGVGVHATFPGPVVFYAPVHKCFENVIRANDGLGNEIETYDSVFVADVTVGSTASLVTLVGPVDAVAYGKIGNTTGTFSTEIVALWLVGDMGGTPVIIRESPTLASTGQTTITDLGGGLYQIDSFFDVFTELSVDGGTTFAPQLDGPGRITLMQSNDPVPVETTNSWGGIKAMYR